MTPEDNLTSIWIPQVSCTWKIAFGTVAYKDENWTECYPHTEEYIDGNVPESQVDTETLTVFKDASYTTCLDTRRSVTEIFILLENVPIFFYKSVRISWKDLPMVANW